MSNSAMFIGVWQQEFPTYDHDEGVFGRSVLVMILMKNCLVQLTQL